MTGKSLIIIVRVSYASCASARCCSLGVLDFYALFSFIGYFHILLSLFFCAIFLVVRSLIRLMGLFVGFDVCAI